MKAVVFFRFSLSLNHWRLWLIDKKQRVFQGFSRPSETLHDKSYTESNEEVSHRKISFKFVSKLFFFHASHPTLYPYCLKLCFLFLIVSCLVAAEGQHIRRSALFMTGDHRNSSEVFGQVSIPWISGRRRWIWHSQVSIRCRLDTQRYTRLVQWLGTNFKPNAWSWDGRVLSFGRVDHRSNQRSTPSAEMSYMWMRHVRESDLYLSDTIRWQVRSLKLRNIVSTAEHSITLLSKKRATVGCEMMQSFGGLCPTATEWHATCAGRKSLDLWILAVSGIQVVIICYCHEVRFFLNVAVWSTITNKMLSSLAVLLCQVTQHVLSPTQLGEGSGRPTGFVSCIGVGCVGGM